MGLARSLFIVSSVSSLFDVSRNALHYLIHLVVAVLKPRICVGHMERMAQEEVPPSLLNRLPYDVRMLVYQHAVANSRIHIIPQNGRLAHISCAAPERAVFTRDRQHLYDGCMLDKNQSCHCGVRTIAVASASNFLPTWVAVPSTGIPLLRACKAM